jgi:hypothetical protein
MHAIHLSDLHVHTNPNWFVVSVGGIVGFGICLFAFVISLMGGDEFIQSLGGYLTLTILVVGLIASIVATFVTMPEEGLGSLPRS